MADDPFAKFEMYDSEEEANKAASSNDPFSKFEMYDSPDQAPQKSNKKPKEMSVSDIPGMQNTLQPQPQAPQTFGQTMLQGGKDALAGIKDIFSPGQDDFEKEIGRKPTFTDKAIRDVFGYAPYAAGGELLGGLAGAGRGILSRLAGQAGAGATYAETHGENPAIGAVTGAAGEGTGTLATKLLIDPLKKVITQSALTPLKERAQNVLNLENKADSTAAYQRASNNYDAHAQAENKQWEKVLKPLAQQIDLMPERFKFNRDQYDQDLIDYGKEIQKKLKQNPHSAELKAADQFITQKLDAPADNFTQMIEHAKGLNDAYGQTLDGTIQVPQSTIENVIRLFKKNANQNMKDNGLVDSLQAEWEKANQLTKDKYRIYHEVPDQSGKVGGSKFINFKNNPSPFADPTSFATDYVPNFKNEKGTQRFDQFRQLVGNKDLADSVLKKQIFGDDLDIKNIVNKYGQMSDAQKADLFKPAERKRLDVASQALKQNPKAFAGEEANKTWIEKYLPSIGLISGVGASFLGKGTTATTGAALGYAGTKAATKGMKALGEMIGASGLGQRAVGNKILGTPGLEDYLRKALTGNFTQRIAVPEVSDENR